MPKNIRKRLKPHKCTIVVELPMADLVEVSDWEIEEDMQLHTDRVRHVIVLLGYRPHGLTAGTYCGGISARGVVRVKTDEEAVQLVTAINRHLLGSAAARIVTVGRGNRRLDRPVPVMAVQVA